MAMLFRRDAPPSGRQPDERVSVFSQVRAKLWAAGKVAFLFGQLFVVSGQL